MKIHNEGNPISPEDQQQIFNPYRRAQAAITGGEKGWGLGLTLVKGIIEAHGGKISLESTEEKGTTFTINLPRDSRPFIQ